MIVPLQRLFALILLIWCVLRTHATLTRKVELEYDNGYFGKPNWVGDLHCPMDYGMTIKSMKIYKLCSGIHCYTLKNYQRNKLEEIKNNCTLQVTCRVQLWQRTYTDGNNVVIDYECDSLLAPHLFTTKMVKRFYHNNDTTQPGEYCSALGVRRVRGLGDNFIGRSAPAAYTFESLLLARMLLALARVRGYYLENVSSVPSVYQTFIRRTRPHPSGGTIDLPVYISANLTLWNTQASNTRSPFNKDITNYLDRCGIRRDPANADDGGHLVAYTLGGTDRPANLVPMARDLNRRQGIWYRHEEMVRQYLRDHPYGMVRWEVLVLYSVRSEEPFRPFGFILRYTEYENEHDLSNGVERIETFINENEHYRNDQCTMDLEDFFNPSNQQDPSLD